MGELVSYRLRDGVATVTMDDGKVNALSPAMLGQVGAALDRAAADGAIVVLAGRPGVFSGGFDLAIVRGGGTRAVGMFRSGFELAARILSFPRPVVIACTGHAVAMGAFLVLSGDYRIGAAGPYRLTANEVAIGLTLPRAAAEICRQRLAPAHFSRATVLAEVYSPDAAVAAGFLDAIAEPAALATAAHDAAQRMRALDPAAHAATKLGVREATLAALHAAIDRDFAAAVASPPAAGAAAPAAR
ncbi:MAG TPA: crotonase/enoyl-CoA hydratase family protein [Streptosporangiaceae bacterium]|nr:crotonase/enoyl-CoA hydratase family protein [Streptosporangiaceae bacterium]